MESSAFAQIVFSVSELAFLQSKLAAFAFVTPMFGVAFGHWFKNEKINALLVIGGLLVGAGIYLTSSDRARHSAPNTVELPGEDAA